MLFLMPNQQRESTEGRTVIKVQNEKRDVEWFVIHCCVYVNFEMSESLCTLLGLLCCVVSIQGLTTRHKLTQDSSAFVTNRQVLSLIDRYSL